MRGKPLFQNRTLCSRTTRQGWEKGGEGRGDPWEKRCKSSERSPDAGTPWMIPTPAHGELGAAPGPHGQGRQPPPGQGSEGCWGPVPSPQGCRGLAGSRRGHGALLCSDGQRGLTAGTWQAGRPVLVTGRPPAERPPGGTQPAPCGLRPPPAPTGVPGTSPCFVTAQGCRKAPLGGFPQRNLAIPSSATELGCSRVLVPVCSHPGLLRVLLTSPQVSPLATLAKESPRL